MPNQNDNTPKRGGTRARRQKATATSEKKARDVSRVSTPPPQKKRITLTDIARYAGVSTSAVSFSLAERLDIPLAKATRERIKQCAKELGYVPNRLREGFFHGRSKLIGILIVTDSYHPFLTCIAGVHEALAQADCWNIRWMGLSIFRFRRIYRMQPPAPASSPAEKSRWLF